MKSILPLATALVLAVVGAQAAPASGLHCNKVAGPGKLVVNTGKHGSQKTYLAATTKHMDGKYRQLAKAENNETKEQFNFYVCDAPKDFYKARNDGKVGQLRSNKHPDLCMTIGGFDYANSQLSMRPCAKSAQDKSLEMQWFRYDVSDKSIVFRGKHDDDMRQVVAFNQAGSVATMFPDPSRKTKGDLKLE